MQCLDALLSTDAFIIMTTPEATNDDKEGIMTTLCFQKMNIILPEVSLTEP